ncbi:MAG: sulfatase-like hydrolase/transferase [Ahniella sp.]|nr:sulfatase-like hydrolase/transferase [Ahniella sp.]
MSRLPAVLAFVAITLVCAVLLMIPEQPARPNILLVTIDTLRADRLGAYGHPLASTPNLDRLAREGTLFEEALSAAPITLPAHTTLLSGLLPPSHGVRDNGAYSVPDSLDMMAERLTALGYESEAFVSAVVLAKRYNIQQGFQRYDDSLWSEEDPKMFMIRERQAVDTVDAALQGFNTWQAKPDRQPFFTWVHLFDPHEPHRAPGAFSQTAATPYDAEISYADQQVGRLLDALREAGELDNTLVIVTADHGESLGEHEERTHAVFVYRATIRVPLIIRQPVRFPRERRISTPVHHMDVLPTVLAAVGAPDPSLPGRDLRQFFAGAAPDRALYSESKLSELGFGMAPLYAIREQGFTYIRAPRPELYELATDPTETRNLIAVPAFATQGANLDLSLDEVFADSAKRAHAVVDNPLTRESIEMLQSLGYLQPSSEREGVAGMDPKDGVRIYNRLDSARKAAQHEDWVRAERLSQAILDELPKHASARGVLAAALLNQGKVDEAKHQYSQMLADNPGEFRILAALASLEVGSGNLDVAEQLFESALSMAPKFIEALSGLGLISMMRGNEAAAEAYFAQVLAIDPDFPGVHRLLGDRFFERGEFANALSAYERSLAGNAEDYRTLLQAAASARRSGYPERAHQYLDQAMVLRPERFAGIYNKACLLALQQRLDEALPLLDRAIELEPSVAALLTQDPDWQATLSDPRIQARLVKTAPTRRREPKAEEP